MKLRLLIGAAILSLVATNAASAADMPVKAPLAVASGGWYGWLDGMYDNVRLPSYGLGWHATTGAPTITDGGPLNRFDPDLDGAGVRGGIGYRVPGTSWRLEADAWYVAARGTQNQSLFGSPNGMSPVLLNGVEPQSSNLNCSGGAACSVAGTLSTNYNSWQASGKAIFDTHVLATTTLSPFVAVFGGESRADQSLTQAATQFFPVGVVAHTGTYAANTSLAWDDVGVRVGFDAKAPISDWLTWNFTGSVGVAGRNVSLNGNDVATSTAAFCCNGASSLATSATTTAVVANLESGFTIRWFDATALRVFGGATFDNKVPGIVGPAYTGFFNNPTPVPAVIGFAQETTWYAGAGLTVGF